MIPITGKTQLTGLLGSPVAHSISPLMHNYSFQALGIDCLYLCFDVKEDGLKEAVLGLRALNVKGFNLTMPNKNKILEYLDELSPAARLIGAVNTVENKNGRLIGHNTDGKGFLRAAAQHGISLLGKTMTLAGIGGAATAICAQAALEGTGCIHIFARSTSAHLDRIRRLIQALSSETSCRIFLHDHENQEELKACLAESTLFVNATSVGMEPEPDASILKHPEWLCPKTAVADIIYNPWETRLLKEARAAGCTAFNGYSMLLYQGAEAFEIWTGQKMPVKDVQAFLQKQ